MIALLALLLVAVPDTTLPAAVQGEWVLAAPVALGTVTPIDGEAYVVRLLAGRVAIRGRTFAMTSVWSVNDELSGGTFTYRLRRDGPGWLPEEPVATEDKAAAVYKVARDTLYVTFADGPAAGRLVYRYVRPAAPAVPPEIVGTWGGVVTDPAGVAVNVTLQFGADGRLTSPEASQAWSFEVVGPYLVLFEPGARCTAFCPSMAVDQISADGGRLSVRLAADGEQIELRRAPAR